MLVSGRVPTLKLKLPLVGWKTTHLKILPVEALDHHSVGFVRQLLVDELGGRGQPVVNAHEGIWNVIWTFFEMDKSCIPVPKLAFLNGGKKKQPDIVDNTYLRSIWSCSDNFHCWVLPGEGLFHQQFLKTIFAFSNMRQLRIWYLDIGIDVLLATNELFFNMLLRAWMHG